MTHKLVLFSFIILLSSCGNKNAEDRVDGYFEKIRNDRAQLNAFFGQMPKGGDLHHHFSGSIYTESYIEYVVAQNYYIDTISLRVDTFRKNVNCLQFSQLRKVARFPKDTTDLLPGFKQKLMQKWSVKDYNGVSYPSDKQFFETFVGFNIAHNRWAQYEAGLLELKARAVKENVSYIETMFTRVTADSVKSVDTGFNRKFLIAGREKDAAAAQSLMQQMYEQMGALKRKQCADTFNKILQQTHTSLGIDDTTFTMRYQTYVLRILPPATVFKNLIVSFEAANNSALLVGVNIVAPEDNEVSMRDYWLHMQMYKFCHALYPKVKYAMHAGELALGLVKPEELTWHINEAVYTAGASRIGHGVDIYYEDSCQQLLRHMAEQKIAIEVSLYSNEFILKVQGSDHPLSLYRKYEVPVVICTDDAGVLRSNLSHQYVLLATRYKDVSYKEIKKIVFNSIDYSFIEEAHVKEQLKADLAARFLRFELHILASGK